MNPHKTPVEQQLQWTLKFLLTWKTAVCDVKISINLKPLKPIIQLPKKMDTSPTSNGWNLKISALVQGETSTQTTKSWIPC